MISRREIGHSVLNVLVVTYNKEEALVGAFSVIMKSSRIFVWSSSLQPQLGRCLLTAPLLVTARPCYKSIRKFFIDAILYNYLKLLNIYLHLNHNFENMTPSKSVRKICEICCKNTFLHNYSMCTGGDDRVLTSEATRRYTKCVQYITITMSVQYVVDKHGTDLVSPAAGWMSMDAILNKVGLFGYWLHISVTPE